MLRAGTENYWVSRAGNSMPIQTTHACSWALEAQSRSIQEWYPLGFSTFVESFSELWSLHELLLKCCLPFLREAIDLSDAPLFKEIVFMNKGVGIGSHSTKQLWLCCDGFCLVSQGNCDLWVCHRNSAHSLNTFRVFSCQAALSQEQSVTGVGFCIPAAIAFGSWGGLWSTAA